MSKATNELAQSAASYVKLVGQIESTIQATLKEAFKEFFRENPDVKGIRWAQYTPFFNDGDACVFGVREFEPVVLNEEGEDDGYADGDFEKSAWGDEIAQKNAKEFTSALEKVPKAVFLAAFGDHCTVKATAEGFGVDEYDHE